MAAPAGNYLAFSGVPLTSPAEFAALLIVVPVLVSPALRASAAGQLARLHATLPSVLAAVVLAALAAKGVLLAHGGDEGFRGCYRSPQAGGPAPCERSYDNPFFRARSTRIDRSIDFGPVRLPARFPAEAFAGGIQASDWRLGFFNSLRFDFYPWERGQPDRARLPFGARWDGEVAGRARSVVVTYVGEGRVRVDGRAVLLPPAYAAERHAAVPVPPGRHHLEVDYRFARTHRIGDGDPGPYALLRLRTTGHAALQAVGPPAAWRALGLSVDAVVVCLLALLLAAYARTLAPAARLLGASLAGLGSTLAMVAAGADSYVLGFTTLLALALAARYRRRLSWTTVGLAVFVVVAGVELARAAVDYGGVDRILYRGGGQDFLTYESFARSILETGSARAGEPVFVYAPLFRYLLFAAHALLGDGDVLIAVAGLTALVWSAVMVALRLLAVRDGEAEAARRPRRRAGNAKRRRGPRQKPSPRVPEPDALDRLFTRRSILVAAAGLVVAFVSSPQVVHMVRALQSEYPTWICLLLVVWLLLGPPKLSRLGAAAALTVVAFITRNDQLVALLLVLAAIAVAASAGVGRRPAVRRCAAVGLVFTSVALLPAAHNLYYGREWAPLVGSQRLAVNFPFPPSRLPSLRSDPAARRVFARQLSAVLVTIDTRGRIHAWDYFVFLVRLIQALWVAAVIRGVARWRSLGVPARLLLLLPVAYLVPHIFVQVLVYYPRHVTAGYLAMALAPALACSDWGQRPVRGDQKKSRSPSWKNQ